VSPRNRNEERWRSGILMELNAVSENLNLPKSHRLRASYRKLFQHVKVRKGQHNWIAHQYGLVDSRLDWMKIWYTINTSLETRLLPELTRVIEQEDSTLLNNKAQHSNHDSENIVESQTSSFLTSEDDTPNE
jgi:hypothetical protein